MKKYHKLTYKTDNILCFYNKYYFFLLDNVDDNGFIHIINTKKDCEMNIFITQNDDGCIINQSDNVKIGYEKPIKFTIPKNSINVKVIITNITYNHKISFINNDSNIITYKEIFLNKHSLKNIMNYLIRIEITCI